MILRELLMRLGLDVDTQSFAKGELLASSVKVALSAIADVARNSIEAIKNAVEYGDRIDEMAQSVGMSTQALQEFHYAVSFAGVGVDEFNGGVMRLSNSMAAAKAGSEEASKAYSRLGVKITDSNGKLRSSEDVLMDLGVAFEKMPEGPEKVATAIQIFGRGGARLLPALTSELANLRQEAEETGVVLGGDAIKASAELNDNFDRLKATTLGLWRSVITPLIPTINDVVKQFLAWRRENAAILRQTITRHLQTMIETLKAVAVALSGVYKGAMFVVDGLTQLWRAVDGPWKYGVLAALTFAFAPLALIGAAIAGILLLLDDYRGYLAGEDSLIGRWKDTLEEWMKPKGEDPWFVAAIKTFLKLITDAMAAIDEFGKKLQGATTRGDKAKVFAGAAAKGVELTTGVVQDLLPRPQYAKNMDERFDAARKNGASLWEAAKYGIFGGEEPMVNAKGGTAAGQGTLNFTPETNITINPPAGASSEDIARDTAQAFDEMWSTKWEEAAAGTTR